AESAETHARCYRRSGAAARAGREALGVPRIATGPVVGVVGCPAPGELVHVRLADDDRTGAPEAGGDRGGLVGHEVRQDLGAGGGADTARVNVVLEGNRDTGERPQVVPGANQALDRLRRVARLLFAYRDVRIQLLVHGADALQRRLRKIHGRQLAALEFRR